jgi:hypothetical protein
MNDALEKELGMQEHSRTLWRVAGVLAIAHVALMFASFAFQNEPDPGSSASTVLADLARGSLTTAYTGSYLTCLSFLVFLVTATLLAQLLRGRDDVTGWLSSLVVASGAVYVALTLGSELVNIEAGRFDGHHGGPVGVLTALNVTHWFGVFLATAVLGVFTLGAAAAVLVGTALPRWVGVAGGVVGVLCLASGAGAQTALVGGATLLWAAWFVGLGVAALRGSRVAVQPALMSEAAVR